MSDKDKPRVLREWRSADERGHEVRHVRYADEGTIRRSATAMPLTIRRSSPVRGTLPAPDGSDAAGDVMVGYFAVFNAPVVIDSQYEGRFVEKIAKGAFRRTIAEDRPLVLWEHGHGDIGNKALGTITSLKEDAHGAAYEVDLLDTSYVDDLVPGLRAGLYGASFRFRVLREAFDDSGERTDWNPEGLPVRTIEEARVFEFGPVAFPAHPDATAAVRSGTGKAASPRSRATKPASRKPKTSPIRHVVMSRWARERLMAEERFDGLETVRAMYGRREGATVYIDELIDVTEAGSQTQSSCRVDRARMEEYRATQAETGRVLLGDLHVHPKSVGAVANPSDPDLRGWCRSVDREGGSYLGLIVQRSHDDDSAWLWPQVTATALTRGDDGRLDVAVLDVEHEPTEGAKRYGSARTTTTRGGSEAWRL